MQVVNRKIHPRWKPLYTNEHRFILFYGGRGGRKSWEIADSLIRKAVQKKTRILCTREIQNSIKDSVYQLLINRANALGYGHEFSVTQNEIVHKKTGSKFIFKGLNDINDKSTQSLKSLEDIDVVWIEEAQTITKNSLSVLIPTIRKPNSQIIASFNPLYETDAIWDYVINPRPRTYICYVTYLDNPDISPEFLEEANNCKNNAPDDYKHIYLGRPKNLLSNACVKRWSDTDNLVTLHYQPDMDLHLSCDFNRGAMAWCIGHYVDDKFFFIDEICKENTYTEECIKIFIEKYIGHRGKIIVTGDASGRFGSAQSPLHNYKIIKIALRRHFKDAQVRFKIRTTNPPRLERVDILDNYVLTMDGVRRVFIDKNKCPNVYSCIKLAKLTDDGKDIYVPGKKDIENNSKELYTEHIYSAVTYWVSNFGKLNNNYVKRNFVDEAM